MVFNKEQLLSIGKAYLFALDKHGNQKRKFSNDPYIKHCELVTCLLSKYTDCNEMLQAAVLHDVVEDTDCTIEEIKDMFGNRVASLVEELTNDQEAIKLIGKREHLLNKLNNISDDALTIKLVDRLHNILCISDDVLCNNFIKKYIRNTIYIVNNFNRKLNIHQNEILITLKTLLGYLDLKLLYKGGVQK